MPILPAALHVSVKPQALQTCIAFGCCGASKDSKTPDRTALEVWSSHRVCARLTPLKVNATFSGTSLLLKQPELCPQRPTAARPQ